MVAGAPAATTNRTSTTASTARPARAPAASAPGYGYFGAGQGYAGGPDESALLKSLLGPGLGVTAADVPDLGVLLVGPMARGAEVSLGEHAMKLLDKKTSFDLAKLVAFMVVTTLATSVLVIIIGNFDFGGSQPVPGRVHRRHRRREGRRHPDRRGQGRHGQGVEIVDRTRALVTFSVQDTTALSKATRADIRYRNLVGQRYISLSNEIGDSAKLPEGATIPASQTSPALDLTVLFNGFKPLFEALTPSDINKLSYEIVQVFQGEGGTLEGLLAHTASVTSTLADRDQIISALIDNLNEVLAHIGSRDDQLNQLITTFRQFVGGLKQDRHAILGSLDQISQLSVQTAGLVQGIRKPFVDDIKNLRTVAENIDRNKGELDRALQVLPIKLEKVGRTAIYGSWFNFYLCQFQGKVTVAGATIPVQYNTGSDRCCSDEHPLPRTQPRRRRGDQPRRRGVVDLRRVQRPEPADHRRRRRLLRRLQGGRWAQGQRRGPRRRRPRRQGREGRARRRPRQGHLPDPDHADFGRDTRADIKVKTLLGAMYLSLEPAGSGQLAAGSEIPVDRTSSPYDVVKAFSGLAETSDKIDTDQLAGALTTLADLTRNTPEEFRSALDGVSRLSNNVAAKDAQIDTLLGNLRNVAGVLHARDQDIVGLMRDSDVLFRALVKRRQSVHRLLVSTSTLSTELTRLVRQSRADLTPALTHLQSVVDVLNKNEDNIDNSLRLMAPFYRVFANTLGNGPWFDTYIQNIPPVPQVG